MNNNDPPGNPPPTPPKAPKKRGRPKKEKVKADPMEKTPGEVKEQECRGRLASDLRSRPVDYLLSPWIPRGMLSMVVGLPAVGKSTFMAWLTSQASNTCILPGEEEDVEVTTLARLSANGVRLGLVRFLDDRTYRLPKDKARLASILTGWEAQLLIVDPIDSYMDEELNENTGRDVRTFLESFAWIAKETGAAVVGVRHPGKDRTNVMPGSRSWRAVPRSIVELVSDGGTPPRLLIRPFKDSLGQDAKPRGFKLEGERGKPRRFILEGELDISLNDLAMVANDPSGRRKVVDAARLIKHMFESEEKPAVSDLVNQCRTLGIGEHARDDAKRLLGILSMPIDAGGKWVMVRKSTEWPSWLLSAET